ncbi:MAG: putative bifunctional diguanylate cyclase/phosphodiesterase [Nevskiaceae bacterium]
MLVAESQLIEALFDPARYHYNATALWHFGAAALMAACAALALYWERGSKVSRLFAGATALLALWSAGRGVAQLLEEPALLLVLWQWTYLAGMISLPLLYQFSVMMVRTDERRATPIRLNWVIGGLFAAAAVGTDAVISGLREYPWGHEPQFGALGYAALAWLGAMMGAVTVDVIRALRRAPRGTLERQRVALFMVAEACLFLGVLDLLPFMGIAVYPAAFIPLTVFVLLTGGITLRYGLVNVTPELATQEIVGLVRGALLILDRDGIIRFGNAEAVALLGTQDLAGVPGRELMGDALSPASLAQLARAEGREAEKEFLFQSNRRNGTVRDLAMTANAVRDRRQRDVAFVCLLRDVTDAKRVQQQRWTEGLRDSLTGLPGRAMFLELLDNAVKRAAETRDYDFAVCFVGVDRLNVVNEDLGYSAGDQVLAEIAKRLRRTSRAQDVVARIGGDEFGILLETSGSEEVQRFVQRLMESVRAPLNLADHDLHLSASIGVAESTWTYGSGAEVLRDAGMAMYRVKQGGGGDAHFVTRSDRGMQRTRLESDMHRALEQNEFRVYYQPVMDLVERRVVGFEALVRWQHPERGLTLPGTFIELAEQIGIARQIDTYVLERACADLARFQEATSDRRLNMSVNMAEACLRDPTFIERVGALLARNGIEPASLRIEVLERVAMIGPLRGTLARLRGLGVGVAVDDFGTGYSSLSRLHELPVSVLKVDREFVRGITAAGGEKIINAIIALAQSLGLTLVAEGASQAREVRRLSDLGCRYVQGFYFSQPVPFEQALAAARQPDGGFAEKFKEVSAGWLATPAAAHPIQPTPATLGSRLGRFFGLH